MKGTKMTEKQQAVIAGLKAFTVQPSLESFEEVLGA